MLEEKAVDKNLSLKDLGLKLLAKGPHKLEQTHRRVRALFGGIYIFDTLEPRHVWEHPYYPQFYVPETAVKHGTLSSKESLDKDGAAFLATLKIKEKTTDRVLGFDKGPLAGLIRFEFAAMGKDHCPLKIFPQLICLKSDAWFEEDQRIYGHPKDPYKRIEILPSSRRITAKIDGVTIAESSQNQFLFETMLPTRYYMPLTAVRY